MNGVTIACVSAGSNQVGASETCKAQVSWPCGAAAPADRGKAAVAAPIAVIASTSRRVCTLADEPRPSPRRADIVINASLMCFVSFLSGYGDAGEKSRPLIAGN